ncbi:MAG: hypothetical protein EBR23_13830 [Planctomycetia bacterium]|nr:hypothetical protein [Planctomycetia bacterium]
MTSPTRLTVGTSILIATLLAMTPIVLTGCGPKPGYSTPTVLSPLGRRGECFACKKPLESVGEEHLFKSRGAQCIVCDKACAAKAAQMMGMDVDAGP